MKQPDPREERKLAARLHLFDLVQARRRGVWSDGVRLYRGDEIDRRIRQVSNRLVNDINEKRLEIGRYDNAIVNFKTVRKKPSIHGLPKATPDMFAALARRSYSRATGREHPSGNASSVSHFLLSRRLARKLGALTRSEMPAGMEKTMLEARFSRPCAVVTRKEILHTPSTGITVSIEPGTRLFGQAGDGWHLPDGRKVNISAAMIVSSGATPVRLRKSEKRKLGLMPEKPSSGPLIDDAKVSDLSM